MQRKSPTASSVAGSKSMGSRTVSQSNIKKPETDAKPSGFKQQQSEEIKEAAQDPYENDEEKYQEHFRKTFITENQRMVDEMGDSKAFSLHEMMIPAGKTAKLIKIPDVSNKDFRISEVADRLKFVEPTPVIILAGAMTERADRTLAGVSRAALRTDAVIFDSGIHSGIEKFCLRRKTPLIGVAPEHMIKYPRIA